jgi:uncharacterized protein
MSLKPLLIGLFVALTVSVSADAATSSRAAAVKPPVPLLWKVSDADNDLYLLGSFHMLKPQDYPLSANVEAAFDDAERLVFELSQAELESPELVTAMAKAAMRTDGKPLNAELPEPMAQQLHAWATTNNKPLQTMGIPPELLQAFEPWFVGITVSLVEMGKMGLDSDHGLDKYMMDRAAKVSKPSSGLETGREQIAVLDGMTKTEQLQFLDESLSDTTNAKAEIEELYRQWRSGDAEGLWQGMAGDMRKEYPQLYRRINVDRNDVWVPKLQRMLDQESKDDVLVVVGALHLLGDDGVVEKLRAKGYTVERICSACADKSATP